MPKHGPMNKADEAILEIDWPRTCSTTTSTRRARERCAAALSKISYSLTRELEKAGVATNVETGRGVWVNPTSKDHKYHKLSERQFSFHTRASKASL